MHPTEPDTSRLRALLLDELDEDERAGLEASLLTDDDEFALLEAVEDELIEDYVRGELDARQRRTLEHGWLTTPRGRARLEVIRAIVDRTTPEPPAARDPARPEATRARRDPVPTPWWRRQWIAWGGLGLAAAAAALMLWLNRRPNGKLGDGGPTVVAVVLTPATTRSVDSTPIVEISTGTRVVRLRLAVTDAPYRRFVAEVRDSKEKTIARTANLSLVDSAEISVDFPADVLGGRYEVWLFGVVEGPPTLVDRYPFEIVRRQ